MIKSNHIKVFAVGPSFAATPTVSTQLFRCLIVWDVQPNGATFALSDLFQDATAGTATLSPLSMANSSRFKVLYDQRVIIHSQPVVTELTIPPNFAHWIEKYQKMNLEAHYSDSNNGDIQDIRTGALFLVMVSDSAAAANRIAATIYNRIRYTDC